MKKILFVFVALVMVFSSFNTFDASSTCTNGSYRNGPGLCGDYPKECSPGSDKLELLWSIPLGMDIPAAPVTDGSRVYFGLPNGMFYCHDQWTGKKIWQYEVKDKCGFDGEERVAGIVSSPAILDGKIYVATTCGKVVCISTENGTKLWQQHVSLRQFISPVVIYDKYLLAVTDDRTCECIDVSTGKYMWTEPCIGNGFSPPCAEKGLMYLPYDNGLKCFDIAKHERVNNESFNAGNSRRVGIPAVEGDKVYYANIDSQLFCFRTSNGSHIWKGNYGVATAICVAKDRLYFGQEKGLTCADRSMGQKLWLFETKATPIAGPVHCDGRIYFGTADNMLYCVNTEGKELFSLKADSAINDTIILSNGLVFFTTKLGRLYCFGPEGSSGLTGKIVLSPLSKKLVPGQSTQINVEFIDRNGKPMEKSELEWSVSPENAGKVSDNTFTAGNFSGKAVITACSGRACESITIEVQRASEAIGYISVQAENEPIIESIPAKFTAKAYDKTARVLQNTSFVWKVEPESAGTIDQNGLFTPSVGGKCRISASIAEIAGSFETNVIGIAKVKISPEAATVAYGKTTQFSVAVMDDSGKDIPGISTAWSVEPESLGTIGKDGLYTAGKLSGNGFVIATTGSKSGKAEIKIVEKDTAPISCDVSVLDFGSLEPNQSKTLKITVTNNTSEDIVVLASSQADWLRAAPGTQTIKTSSGQVIEITASPVSKPIGMLETKISIQAKDFTLEIQAKLNVVKLVDCFYITSSNLTGEVSPDRQTIFTASVGCGKSTAIPVTISSTHKNVTLKTPNFEILKTSTFELEVNSNGLRLGDKIEGTINLVPSAQSGCKTLSIPFSFIVKQKQTQIWLQIGNTSAKIDGKETTLQVPPQVIKGNTMVPLRFIAEAFGCQVNWNASEKKITINRGSFEMIIWMDKTTAKINGQNKTMKAPPTSVNGKTLVPLRFIAEAFGAIVNYNSKTQEIDILWTPN